MVSASSLGLSSPGWMVSNARSEKSESKDPGTLPGSHCPCGVCCRMGERFSDSSVGSQPRPVPEAAYAICYTFLNFTEFPHL